MTSKAQRKATEKYLSGKKRLNIVFDPEDIKEIEEILSKSYLNKTVPEFIRNATMYYLYQIKEGKISCYPIDQDSTE